MTSGVLFSFHNFKASILYPFLLLIFMVGEGENFRCYSFSDSSTIGTRKVESKLIP